jgi:hypothetical protein
MDCHLPKIVSILSSPLWLAAACLISQGITCSACITRTDFPVCNNLYVVTNILKWRLGRKVLRSMGIDFGKNRIMITTTQTYYCGRVVLLRFTPSMVTRTTGFNIYTRKNKKQETRTRKKACERLQISTYIQARARTDLRTKHSNLWNAS